MALIQRVSIAPKLAFLARRKMFLGFSACLIVASVALFLVQGLNLGVDFRGGILIEARTDGPADLSALRDRLGSLGLGEITLQEFGTPTDVLINVRRQDGDEAEQIKAIQVVKEALGDDVVEYRRTEFVGPKVGSELKRAGALATSLALLAIGVYIWFRFEWQFSVAALAALLHDVVATVGFYTITQIEFNLATLAAILTIAGYSISCRERPIRSHRDRATAPVRCRAGHSAPASSTDSRAHGHSDPLRRGGAAPPGSSCPHRCRCRPGERRSRPSEGCLTAGEFGQGDDQTPEVRLAVIGANRDAQPRTTLGHGREAYRRHAKTPLGQRLRPTCGAGVATETHHQDVGVGSLRRLDAVSEDIAQGRS